jgi:hypothetical protein
MSRLRTSLALTLALALIAAGGASAHADLVRSNPAVNSTLKSAPTTITLDFSEAIEPAFSKITVLFEDGATADNGDSAFSDRSRQLTVSLREARQGTYTCVVARAQRRGRAHHVGRVCVSVGQRSIKPWARIKRWGGHVARHAGRALTFIGQALIVGLVAFRWLVWRPALQSAQLDAAADEATYARNTRLMYVALGLTAVGAFIVLLSQSALNDSTIFAWLGTRVGRVWLARVATLIVIGVLARRFALTLRYAPPSPKGREPGARWSCSG